MNNNPLISIILPVYNVEKYLLQSLESIKTQTYTNLEVIIVIDGSTDNSYNIAKNYSLTDQRFIVIYQENKGSGPARNNGIQHSHGEFIVFIDPDDWVEKDFIKTLYDKYIETQSDFIISSKIDMIFSKKNILIKQVKRNIPEIDLKTQWQVRSNYMNLYSHNMINSPAEKLYKANIIKKYNIEFPDLRRSQDIVFNYRYYNYINSLCTINYHGYLYRINISSYNSKLKEDYYKTITQIYSDIKLLHKSWNVKFDDKTLSNISFSFINSYIESMILRKCCYKKVLKDPIIIHIINTASPNNFYKRIIHLAVKNRFWKIIKLIMTTKFLLKKIYYYK